MIARWPRLPPEPGDIYIVNDPYLGGTHLMDVRFAMPVYRDGAIFCWLSNTGHWPDIGGMVPGGFSASATAVEQEGLRLPPVKLFKKGVLDPEIYAIITSNIRVADQRIGDIKAQAAALLVGEERLFDHPRPLRRRHRQRGDRRAARPRRRPDARPHRRHSRWHLPLEGLRRFRRRRRTSR
jgi:N-methylhydantoinase B